MKRKRMLFLLLCVCLAASAAAGCTSEGPASALSDPLPSQGGEIQGMPVELRVETPVQPGASVLRLWWVNRGETDVSYSPHTNISIEVWQDGAWMEVPKTPDALLSNVPIAMAFPASSEGRMAVDLSEWDSSFGPGQYRLGIDTDVGGNGRYQYIPSRETDDPGWIAVEFRIE